MNGQPFNENCTQPTPAGTKAIKQALLSRAFYFFIFLSLRILLNLSLSLVFCYLLPFLVNCLHLVSCRCNVLHINRGHIQRPHHLARPNIRSVFFSQCCHQFIFKRIDAMAIQIFPSITVLFGTLQLLYFYSQFIVDKTLIFLSAQAAKKEISQSLYTLCSLCMGLS